MWPWSDETARMPLETAAPAAVDVVNDEHPSASFRVRGDLVEVSTESALFRRHRGETGELCVGFPVVFEWLFRHPLSADEMAVLGLVKTVDSWAFTSDTLFKLHGRIRSVSSRGYDIQFQRQMPQRDFAAMFPGRIGRVEENRGEAKIIGALNASVRNDLAAYCMRHRRHSIIDLSSTTAIDQEGVKAAQMLTRFGAEIKGCSSEIRSDLLAGGVCKDCRATCAASAFAKGKTNILKRA